jgi:hypothetical protein
MYTEHQRDLQHQEAMNILITESEYKLFQMLKPKLYKDGNQWCVLLGKNIQEGVCGFGDSPYLAILAFNKAMTTTINPY